MKISDRVTRVREHRGGLAESMATVQEVHSRDDLLRVVQASFGSFPIVVTHDKLHVKPYGYDARINWDTHLITVEGHGVWGMSDGPL